MEFRSIPSRTVFARLIFALPSPKFHRIVRYFIIGPFWCSHWWKKKRWNSFRFPTDLGNILERDWSSSLRCWLSAGNLSGEREGVTPMLQCDMASSLSQPRAQDHSLIVEISMRWIFFMVHDNTCKTIGMHSYKWCRNMSSQYVHIPKAL